MKEQWNAIGLVASFFLLTVIALGMMAVFKGIFTLFGLLKQ